MTPVQLAAPVALFALLPLGAASILLYLLMLRRREVLVPSVMLWRRAADDMQANAPFQKLRYNLLMLLQVAALAAVVLGLAGPYIMSGRLTGRSTVLVLDASASMRATDVPQGRFEQARSKALEAVAGMARGDEAAVVVVASRATVALPFTSDRRRLETTLRAMQPTDCTTNMRDGLLLALSLAGKRPRSTVLVLSDGGFAALPSVPPSADVKFIRIGQRSANLAIMAFQASRSPATGKHDLFVRLHNYGVGPQQSTLCIYQEQQLVDARTVTVAANSDHIENCSLALPQGGLLRAQLEVKDDLAADNVAYASAESGAALSVLLATPGNLFLEQALLVVPGVKLYRVGQLDAAQAAAAFDKYDVVILDRVPAPPLPVSGAVMLVACPDMQQPAALAESLATPAVTRWEMQHPALRHVNLSAAQLSRATALAAAPGARTLAWAGERPVVVALDNPGLRALAFGWNFLDSDLPLRVGFPVLLRNCVEWLAEGRGRKGLTVRTGGILRLPTPVNAASATESLPDGGRLQARVVGGEVTLANVDRVGEYSLAVSGQPCRRWAADLCDREESNLTPRDAIQLGARRIASNSALARAERPLWPYLALLALALLLGEWHLYHRRL